MADDYEEPTPLEEDRQQLTAAEFIVEIIQTIRMKTLEQAEDGEDANDIRNAFFDQLRQRSISLCDLLAEHALETLSPEDTRAMESERRWWARVYRHARWYKRVHMDEDGLEYCSTNDDARIQRAVAALKKLGWTEGDLADLAEHCDY
jgi:hypothetical protein